jgi:signal transduction histidine kinase
VSATLLGPASSEAAIPLFDASGETPRVDERARLDRAVDALLGALTPWEVARALVTLGAAAAGATGAAVAAFRRDALELLLAQGAHGGELVPLGRSSWIDRGPLADALRTATPVWLEDSDAAHGDPPSPAALAALPLRVRSGTLVVGVLAFEWTTPPTPDARAAAAEVARLGAPALHRALRNDVERDRAADAEVRAREAHRRARQQEHLMAVAGHDLRTPLQTVIMGARLVTQQGLLTPAQAVTAGRMARSAERAAGIIRDLLDLGRARQGLAVRIAPRPADLGALAEAAVVELEQAYPERVIGCTVRGDAAGVWDAGRLSRVLSNLVQNALEHGGSRARVGVEVDGERDEVRLTVRHDGPPMSRERIARVLDPASGHAGLGLAIVREIVRAHGGALAARSSPEDGTVFEVALPRQSPAG